MCPESECVTFMPPLIIRLIHQVGPLNAFDLYFCITFLFLLRSPPCLPLYSLYLSITLWPFPTLLMSLPCLFFCFFFLLNRLIMPLIFLPCLWTSFSFYSLIWSLLLPLAPLSTLYRFYPPKFVIFLSPLFVFLSHRPSHCQCCHHGRGAAAPSGSGGLPPRGVCQCLLPRLTGAAESGRELHAHPGLCALWHR